MGNLFFRGFLNSVGWRKCNVLGKRVFDKGIAGLTSLSPAYEKLTCHGRRDKVYPAIEKQIGLW